MVAPQVTDSSRCPGLMMLRAVLSSLSQVRPPYFGKVRESKGLILKHWHECASSGHVGEACRDGSSIGLTPVSMRLPACRSALGFQAGPVPTAPPRDGDHVPARRMGTHSPASLQDRCWRWPSVSYKTYLLVI